MSRRRVLRGVAAGVATAFCSRPNDIQGAWLPGVLCERLLNHGRTAYTFDLFDAEGGDLDLLIGLRYRSQIDRHLARLGLPAKTVTSATIRFLLEPRVPSLTRETWLIPTPHTVRPTYWVCAEVALIDDLGVARLASARTWCWPDARPLPIPEGSRYQADGREAR